MDWYNRSKRVSISSGMPPYGSPNLGGAISSFSSPQQQRSQYYNNYHPLLPPSSTLAGANSNTNSNLETSPSDRTSYYFSPYPLYCSDWVHLSGVELECIALSSYKEGFKNKLQVVHGVAYDKYATIDPEDSIDSTSLNQVENSIEGFDFHKVSEVSVDYPITNLQWDPSLSRFSNGYQERLAASSEILRLYKVDHESIDQNNDYKLAQTHILANNTNASSATGGNYNKEEINTFPPVTSFDWNKTDPSIIITSSIDTTCTVWDLHRSHPIQDKTSNNATDAALIKTQLIAHDSEVFDVKFIHNSTNIFASVGNDGSMRVFDLRSLEHSTIIYEPTVSPQASLSATSKKSSINSKALLKLSTSNIDQYYSATIGVNSNQVTIIDMRMPGMPVATIDGSLGGMNTAAINSIRWHPNSNFLLTGGDDCHALVWDCNNIGQTKPSSPDLGSVIEMPILGYQEDLEVNNTCWRANDGDWMGVVSGKGFQAVQL